MHAPQKLIYLKLYEGVSSRLRFEGARRAGPPTKLSKLRSNYVYLICLEVLAALGVGLGRRPRDSDWIVSFETH